MSKNSLYACLVYSSWMLTNLYLIKQFTCGVILLRYIDAYALILLLFWATKTADWGNN